MSIGVNLSEVTCAIALENKRDRNNPVWSGRTRPASYLCAIALLDRQCDHLQQVNADSMVFLN